MSQKNETTVLVLALLITAVVLGGGFWWFSRRTGFSLSDLPNGANDNASEPAPNAPDAPAEPSTPSALGSESLAQVPAPSGLFNYGGSTSWAPIRRSVDAALQAAQPDFRLRYLDPASGSPSSTKGIEMLIDGQLNFAQSSRPIQDEEYGRAQQRGFTLQQIPVAIDGIAVAVNPSLNLPGLTLAQLKSIYTGALTNWQQVGGPNLTITPYSRPVNSGGTVDLFAEEVLGGQGFGASVQFVSTTTAALRALGNAPGGIYFASAPEVVPQCTVKPLPLGREANQLVAPFQSPLVPASQCPGQRNQLNIEAFQNGSYPLTRNLFVVVKKDGQVDEQAGTAYANLLLSNQGQEQIGEAGFVRIR